jgi:2,4-didehydro-3-deoxy-L-rhamnonate hydrolase
MKLVRYGDAGAEKPSLLDADGSLRDLWPVILHIDKDALVPECLQELGKP